MKARFILKAISIVGFLFPTFGHTDELAGMRAYQAGDYATAARHFTADAEKGDPAAQYRLALLYQEGQGVSQNCPEATKWFLRSADGAYGPAQLQLAGLYKSGFCVEKDNGAAIKWMRKAAEGGNAEAQYSLGHMLLSGDNASETLDWFRRSAEQGHREAQFFLAFLLDPSPTYDAAGRRTHSTKFKEDPKEAAKWRRMAAEQGDTGQQASLGEMYRDGRGVPQSDREALKWFRLSAEANDAQGQMMMSEMFRDGRGVPQDYVQAHMWANVAASHGMEQFADTGAIIGAQNFEKFRLWRISVRDDLARKMTPEQIERAQELARNWRPTGKSGKNTDPEPERTGTGFQISTDGYVLTNYHVVEGCSSIYVGGSGKREEVSVTASDAANDLALVEGAHFLTSPLAFSKNGGVKLGQDIIVLGYPLHGLLAQSMNVTGGSVSALAGIQNDVRMIQITAPVQPGNSGGPLLDESGNVVGVVSSKLNSLKAAKLLGDVTQNINFAIKAAVVRSFLDLSGVEYLTRKSDTVLRKPQIADRAKGAVVLIERWK